MTKFVFTDNLNGLQLTATIVALVLPYCKDAILALDPMKDRVDDKFQYYCYQLEYASRYHLQGYVQLVRDYRFLTVKKLFVRAPHIERQRGTNDEARKYCMKEDGTQIKFSFFEMGIYLKGQQGKRSDILRAIDTLDKGGIKQCILDYPDVFIKYHRGFEKYIDMTKEYSMQRWRNISVTILWGMPGTGKSRHAWKRSDIYKVNYDINKLWFDGYNYQRCLLIDEFYGQIKYSVLMEILDGHPYRAEIKGGFKMAAWEKIYIISNVNPHKWYENHWNKYPETFKAFKRRVKKIRYFDFTGIHKWGWMA